METVKQKRNETNGTGNHTQNIDSADHAACCAGLNCSFKYERPQRLNQLLSEHMSDSERAY